MDKNIIGELVGSYAYYTGAEEIYATSDAPATTPSCLASAISFNLGGSLVTTLRNC